jgi:hypothetical protein
MLRFTLVVLVTLLSAANLSADGLDSGVPGVWIESTVAPDFVENMDWIISPDGSFTEGIQHTPPNGTVNLHDTSSNESSYDGTMTTSNGQFTLSFSDGSTNAGSYAISDDQSKMLMKEDTVANAYLFQRYATLKGDGSDWNILPVTTGGLTCLLSGPTGTVNLNHYGPAHWVQPGLVGIWIAGAPTAAQPNTKTAIWVIQPDGASTLHVQNVTASQPMDPNSSAHDASTQIGFIDIFGGRFCFTSSDGSGHDTGTYTISGDQLSLTFDTGNNPASVFKRAGYFNLDGTVHLN